MYATISRARLSCNSICVPCLNSTARRARRFPPCLLRNITNTATTPAATDNEDIARRIIKDDLPQGCLEVVEPPKDADQKKLAKSKQKSKNHPRPMEEAVGNDAPKDKDDAQRLRRRERRKQRKLLAQSGTETPGDKLVSELKNAANSKEEEALTESVPSRRKVRRSRRERMKMKAKSETETIGDGLVSELQNASISKGDDFSTATSTDDAPKEQKKGKKKEELKARPRKTVIKKVLGGHKVRPRLVLSSSNKPDKAEATQPRRGPLLNDLYRIVNKVSVAHAKTMLLNFLEENENVLSNHAKKTIAQRSQSAFATLETPSSMLAEATLNATLRNTYTTLEEALKQKSPASDLDSKSLPSGKNHITGDINASELELKPIDVPQPPVPGVVYGLDRVLFNPGVYQLRDSHSQVYNFDPYLESITPVKEFDFSALKEYITSSRDTALINIATQEKVKYTGSTSSMTSALAHFHYLLSKWRPINLSQLSRGFPSPLTSFSAMQRSPTGIFLRWRDGVYAIDASKEFDTANVLMYLGKSMEKFLTASREEYEMFRKEHSHKLSEKDKDTPESYHYTTQGDFLMRSQLDAHDPRLPGTGMFDLKTRAVVSIRKDATNYEGGLGYELRNRTGEWESFEREYYDLCRSAFMKYSLQARMGRMDGIFVAYHNVERIFGFQYLPISAMDEAIHGTSDTTLGDAEFKVSVAFLNQLLDRLTEKFPEQSLQIDFETRPLSKASKTPEADCFMYVFAQPTSEEEIKSIQERNLKEITEYERLVIGLDPRQQKDLVQAGLEREAKEAELEDEAERLEEAIEHPFLPENIQVLREAVKKMKEHDTDTENAVHKALEMVEARLREETEATADEITENVTKSEDDNVSWKSEKPEKSGKPKRPIVGYKILVKNFVNGVQVIRPTKLSSDKKWEVKYSIEVLSEKAARNAYTLLKARKLKLQGGTRKENPHQDKFSHDIVEAVKSGKLHRRQQNEKDAIFGVKSLTDNAQSVFTPIRAEEVQQTQPKQEKVKQAVVQSEDGATSSKKPATEDKEAVAPPPVEQGGVKVLKDESSKKEAKSKKKEKPWWFL